MVSHLRGGFSALKDLWAIAADHIVDYNHSFDHNIADYFSRNTAGHTDNSSHNINCYHSTVNSDRSKYIDHFHHSSHFGHTADCC